MKKIYTLLAGLAALPMSMSAVDYTPTAPENVEYLTCFVQTRTLRDADGDRVTSVGDNGDVRVVGRRLVGDEYLPAGKINFVIPNTYDGTKKIANDKLEYRILIVREGQTEEQAEPYIFDAENHYIKWEQNGYEPMEWVNNDFTDSFDFGLSLGVDDGPNTHSIYFYGVSDDITKIGVQSRWTRSSKTYESAITWADPTTPDLTGVLTWEEWEALVNEYNNPNQYKPAAPDPVEYLTCFVQTRTLRDGDGERVTSVGDNGDVQVVGRRLVGDEYLPAGKINFTINNTYDGDKKIANNKLEYRILILRNGQTEAQAEPYIFDAENHYSKWEQNGYEPMEWVNNDFTDSYDLGLSLGENGGPNVHSIYFYGVSDDITKIGVQSRWTRSDKIYESDITWADPTTPDLTGVLTWDEWKALEEKVAGVDMVISDAAAVEYFDLQGRRVANPANGLFIIRTVDANGGVKVAKIIK